jgi:hypothetical protein
LGARLYLRYGRKELSISTQLTAALARQHNLDVQAVAVQGGHTSAEDADIKMAIDVFRENK